jgi:hypothetical protein
MAFKVTSAMVDVINATANVVAIDQTPTGGPSKMVQISFPFHPPAAEGQEKQRVIDEAKRVLQQALSEI